MCRYTRFFHIIVYTVCSISLLKILPYILKICGFKNSTVYTFYSMYQKYTFFVKLYICGLTYRLSVRYKHKLRIDVITYVPTLANDPPFCCCCLSTTAIIVAVPAVPGYRNIRTSGRSMLHRYGTVYFALEVDPRDPPLDLWDGIPPGISSRRVTAALGRPQKFHRKVCPADPSRNAQMMGSGWVWSSGGD